MLARPFRYFRGCKLIIIAYLLFFLYKKGGLTVNAVVFFIVMILLLILFIATIKMNHFILCLYEENKCYYSVL